MTIQQESKKATRNANLYILESIWHGTNCSLILTKTPPCIKKDDFSAYIFIEHMNSIRFYSLSKINLRSRHTDWN